jgi:hypothetical protein
MTSLADLKSQRAEIDRAMAALEKPMIEQASLLLAQAGSMRSQLAQIRDELPDGGARTQIGNVITVLDAVPKVLTQELARIESTLAPPPTIAPATPSQTGQG